MVEADVLERVGDALDEVVLLDDGHVSPSSGYAGRYDFIPMQG